MTAAGIGEQLVEQIAVPAAIPQMMMRIDDLERRLEDLVLAPRPPVLPTRTGATYLGTPPAPTPEPEHATCVQPVVLASVVSIVELASCPELR